MKTVFNVVSTLAFVLDSIELSWQFDCLPNGEPISKIPRGKSSSTAVRHHPSARSLPLAEISVRERSRSPRGAGMSEVPLPGELSWQFDCLPDDNTIPRIPFVEPYSTPGRHHPTDKFTLPPQIPVRNRSTSPSGGSLTSSFSEIAAPTMRRLDHGPDLIRANPHLQDQPCSSISTPPRFMAPTTRLPSPNGVGCGLDKLRSIRLIPMKDPNHIFELRRYTFPADTPLKIKVDSYRYNANPINEQIVLSTSNCDVLAILQRCDTLAGIYIYDRKTKSQRRAKINISSSKITALTREEISEVIVGSRNSMANYFQVKFVNQV